MMRFVAAACLAVAVSAASAPAVEFLPHRCEGHVDYACTDPSGAFCTIWLGFRCEIGT
jgi:hypothetical protein